MTATTPPERAAGASPVSPPAPPGTVQPPVTVPGQSSPPPPDRSGSRGVTAGIPAGSVSSEGTSTLPAGSRAVIAAAMSEDRGPDSLDAHVRRLLKDLGLLGYHTHDSRRSHGGYPDWTVAGIGGVLFRELKTQRGRVSAEQQQWLDALAAAGQDAGVWRPEDLLSGRIARELATISGWARGAA